MTKWFCDGSGWNGETSGYAVCNTIGFSEIVRDEQQKTNNEREYEAVIRALNLSVIGDEIYTDSQLVVNQTKGLWKVKEMRLFSLVMLAADLVKVKAIKLLWCRREMNMAGHLLESKVR